MTPEKVRTLAANIRGAQNQNEARTRYHAAQAYSYAMHELKHLSDENLQVSLEIIAEAFHKRMNLGRAPAHTPNREQLGLD